MNLLRPIVFFDLETTGTNVNTDRIVEFGAIKIFPAGDIKANNPLKFVFRINPEMPIPAGATEVHGITDGAVEFEPTLKNWQ
jgi:DNA polymerase-3 subunit epsilon